MPTRDEPIRIAVDRETIDGTLVSTATRLPGVLFVHGWGGNQTQYLARAQRIAALGCVCLTFDLRGHAARRDEQETVSREQSMRDVLAAYDTLVAHPLVDGDAMAVVGSSYGGYLAALLTAQRPVRWLGLRVPALYKDEDWSVPKRRLDRAEIDAYRRAVIRPDENRALAACAAFRGDVLIVSSEHDRIIPPRVIENYRAAFCAVRSLASHVIEGADHGLSDERSQHVYTGLLVEWFAQRLKDAHAAAPDTVLLEPRVRRPGARAAEPPAGAGPARRDEAHAAERP